MFLNLFDAVDNTNNYFFFFFLQLFLLITLQYTIFVIINRTARPSSQCRKAKQRSLVQYSLLDFWNIIYGDDKCNFIIFVKILCKFGFDAQSVHGGMLRMRCSAKNVQISVISWNPKVGHETVFWWITSLSQISILKKYENTSQIC